MCLYIDNMIVVVSNDKVIRSTKNILNSKFDMKDLGLVDVILCVKIIKIFDGLALSQTHYIDKILEKFNKSDSNVVITLVDVNLHLSKNGGKYIPIGVFLYNWKFNVLDEVYKA